MFVGRKKELAYLEELYKKDMSNVLCMYGHRGVGKTSLMLGFANSKNCQYILGRACSEDQLISLFARELDVTLKEGDGFDELFSRIEFKGEGKKLLLIDEFHNIVKYSDAFIPALMKYVAESETNILVILCSSSISFVENTLVPKIGGYAQRFSGFFKVAPLTFMDCVNYFSGYDTISCMQVYSLLGGMPSYWSRFSDKLTVNENIKRAILHPDAFLRDEGTSIISDELRETNVYATILYYLAGGSNKLNELHVNTGYSRAKISVYIKNLMEREIVEKVFSYDNASSINAKKGVYRINNPYLHFYFKYIFKNESKLVTMGPVRFFEFYIANDLDNFYEEHFKSVCTEFLSLLNQMGRLPFKSSRIGEWVGKKGNIDVVMQNDDEDSIVAFCNWKKELITIKDYKNYLSIASDARIHPDYMIILARGEFDKALSDLTKEVDNIMLIQASSL